MIVLRTLDKEAYDRLASGASDAFETAAALSNKIGENPAALNDVNAFHNGQLALEVSLFAELRGFFLQPEQDGIDAFVSSYVEAFVAQFNSHFQGRPPNVPYGDRARHVAHAALALFGKGHEGSKSIHEIRRLLEIVDYDPDP